MNWDNLISTMEREAIRRNAPVFTLKLKSKEPFQIMVSAILSARTRDETTIKIVNRLFKKIKKPDDILKLSLNDLENLLYGVGFYRNKAKILKELAKTLVERSNIPNNFNELVKLPGVGRKVANIILAEVFGRDVIAVDTHVHRISNRLGVIKTRSPEETESELKKVIPKHLWRRINKAFVGFGQTVCLPKNPLCEECPINKNCQYYKNRKSELNKLKYKRDGNLKNNKKS